MSNDNRSQDESLLVDFVMGECPEEVAQRVRERLEKDPSLRHLRTDIANTLEVMKLAPDCEAPGDLVAATMHRIRQARQTEALLAREQMARRVVPATFSLRELAAVAASLLLMAAIFVPSLREARRRAFTGQCASQAGQIGTGLLGYANSHGGNLPGVNSPRPRWLPSQGGQAVVNNSTGLFILVKSGYASPVVFQCPAVSGGNVAGLVVQTCMNDFPGERYIQYSYQYSLGDQPLSIRNSALAAVAGSMAILADNTPVFRDGRFLRDKVTAAASDNHDRSGQNILYLDQHVDWSDRAGAGVHGNNIFLAEGIYDYQGEETPIAPTDSFLLPAWSPVSETPSN